MTNRFRCLNCYGSRFIVRIPTSALHPDLVQCQECLAEMFWPIPSESDLNEYYRNENSLTALGRTTADAYLDFPDQHREWAKNYADELRAVGVPENGTVVDLGCNFGVDVIEWCKLGLDGWGVDPSQYAIEWMKGHGANGYCGTIFDQDFPLTRIHALRTLHSLEHMPDPYAALRRIHFLLVPAAPIVIAVPNWGGLVARQQSAAWKWFGYPGHLHYFTKDSFPRILSEMGFEVYEVRTEVLAEDVDDAMAAFGVPETERPHGRRAVDTILRTGNLGEALVIRARKKP